ncbi:Obg family GTPase CgtA [Candidatus Bandiella euplotis]|uniref:GTPase Obg n=1 Tax=Candidatus Bandiella euplotis TaxID=1664265 RepID=A0ABZ0UN24_9RICK|nr:GTPase ObgE [Candidatus Bandiella woodruffii]WPX96225.1 GTPase ObgE [Candidatus Bandiella woodruffii]
MHFIDEVKIYLKAGDGGNGTASFRREKFIEMGGPDGGNGGRGGSVIIRATPNLNTLIDFRYKQHFKAQQGQKGSGQNKTGRSGEDLIIEVPVGTQILSEDKKYVLYDMDNAEQEESIINGGRGGVGNSSFKSSRNQAPRKFTEGEPGAEMWVWLNLKLLSNVGLLGLPNAGKSTFLSRVSSAKPKIANYPFTTLVPQLGVVYFEQKEFTIADLPGLIENASKGEGLGIRFLKHMERCQLLLHVLDITSEDVIKDYEIIRNELRNFGNLTEKKEMVMFSKVDLLHNEEVLMKVRDFEKYVKKEVMFYSGMTQQGLDAVVKNIFSQLNI